ncbi:MAG TPA: MBL fold metallo-hydrolase [Longimicrobium sp.]|jgi:glyoxylase-like metal-dependent hydrolase (beta-lactamase superfamily II)
MPLHTKRRHLLLTALLLAPTPAALTAQAPQGPLWSSYSRAAEVLRLGAEAHGGAAAIRGLTAASFRWEGEDYAPTQGRVPAASWDTAGNARAVVSDVRVDLAGGRFAWDREFSFGGGYLNAFRWAGSGREFLSYNHRPERGMGGTTFQRDTTGTQQRRALSSLGANMPVLLIRQALDRSNTLRHLGRTGQEEAISYTTAEGDPVTLYFDTATHLLIRREEMGNGSLGDEVDAVHFAGYEQVAGFAVPRRLELRWNGLLTGRQRLVSFAPAAELPDSLFRVPAGYAFPAPGGAPAMTRVAEGVYFVERIGGGYRSLVVDTDEGLVVVDAPLNPEATGAAIALIEHTFPGRPIRYVVITHHHGDHIGGIPAYAARGATILVAPGSEAYIRRMISVTRTLGRIGQPRRAPAPEAVFETLSGRRTIGRGARAVEVLNVGPTSHAAAMLAVYVPAQKLLFQGDLLRINEQGGPVVSPDANRDLESLIRRFRLDVRTIGAVHGLNGTMDDLREAIRRGASAH